LVRFDVWLPLGTVKDVIRRVIDDRCPQVCNIPRTSYVHRLSDVGPTLSPVYVRPSGSVEYEFRRVVERRRCNVEELPNACISLGKLLTQRLAELAAGARDQETASRSERIGDSVLQRCATRGSFQGNSCSSGSSRSYSSVTW